MISWQCLSFSELTTAQLYELLKLRVDVFVVEQQCPYPEIDGKDHLADVYHLMGYENGKLIACARLLAAGISFTNVAIGRVATCATARKNGLGRALMQHALSECQRLWPDQAIDIQAQQYLTSFYQDFGFIPYTEVYLEDGIPHLDMRRSNKSPS